MKSRLALVLFVFGCGGGEADPVPDAPVATARCVEPDVLTALDAYVERLAASASLTATHPGPNEAVGFYELPLLELTRPAVFAGLFIAPCMDGAPMMFVESCEEDGVCSQLECTGVGAGWEFHFFIKQPAGTDPSYSAATVDTAWADGETAMTFDIAATASGTDDWSMSGSGTMDVDSFSTELTFPALSSEGSLVLTASVAADGTHGGQITIAGEVAANADPATGTYVPVASCQ